MTKSICFKTKTGWQFANKFAWENEVEFRNNSCFWSSSGALKFLPLNYFQVEKFREFERDFWNFYFCKSTSADKIFYFKTLTRWKFPALLRRAFQRRDIYTTRFRWTENACFKMFTSWKFLTILEANFKSCGPFTINFRWTKNICFKTLTSWKFLTILEANFKSCGQFTINFYWTKYICFKKAHELKNFEIRKSNFCK